MQILHISTSLLGLNETLLESHTDKDRCTSIGADAITHLVILCVHLNATLVHYLPKKPYMIDMRNAHSLCLDLTKIGTELIETLTTMMSHPWKDVKSDKAIKEGIMALGQAILNATDSTLHDLFSREIEKRGAIDRLLMERNSHIMARPFISYELRSNSIYPVTYMLMDMPSKFLLSLLKNCGIVWENSLLMLHDVSQAIFVYTNYLEYHNFYSRASIAKALSTALNHKFQTINVLDHRSLIWPLQNVLIPTSFAMNWNAKFPKKVTLYEKNSKNLKYPEHKIIDFEKFTLRKTLFERSLKNIDARLARQKEMKKPNPPSSPTDLDFDIDLEINTINQEISRVDEYIETGKELAL